jgi:hypothetical protein
VLEVIPGIPITGIPIICADRESAARCHRRFWRETCQQLCTTHLCSDQYCLARSLEIRGPGLSICLHDIGHAWQALALAARSLGSESGQPGGPIVSPEGPHPWRTPQTRHSASQSPGANRPVPGAPLHPNEMPAAPRAAAQPSSPWRNHNFLSGGVCI